MHTLIISIIATCWIILMYEAGQKLINPKALNNWKYVVLFILGTAIFVYIFLTMKDPDTGIASPFNLDLFIKVFVTTILSLLAGFYIKKKK